MTNVYSFMQGNLTRGYPAYHGTSRDEDFNQSNPACVPYDLRVGAIRVDTVYRDGQIIRVNRYGH